MGEDGPPDHGVEYRPIPFAARRVPPGPPCAFPRSSALTAPDPADQPLFSHRTDDEPVVYPAPVREQDLDAPFSAPAD
ncbi:hypothetical protein GCM10023214_22030 [Amycolatopsis dongchuanensis]|uniref:Uncharacterized protein n=1 Tax=Amycolatopsis dongchuanensis TaxID=1070866 RepID=A0ABP9QC18_9PSEU